MNRRLAFIVMVLTAGSFYACGAQSLAPVDGQHPADATDPVPDGGPSPDMLSKDTPWSDVPQPDAHTDVLGDTEEPCLSDEAFFETYLWKPTPSTTCVV